MPTRDIVIIFVRFTYISWRDYLKIVKSVSLFLLYRRPVAILFIIYRFFLRVIFYYTVHIILNFNSRFWLYISLAKCIDLGLQPTDPTIRTLPGIHIELQFFFFFLRREALVSKKSLDGNVVCKRYIFAFLFYPIVHPLCMPHVFVC